MTGGTTAVLALGCVIGAATGSNVSLAEQSVQETLAQAETLRTEMRLDEAVDLLNRALAVTPEDRELRFLLAESLSWQGEYARAIPLLLALENEEPSRDVRLALGRALLWSGRYEDAAERFDQLLASAPNDLDPLEELARTRYWQGDYREAARLYRDLLERDPSRTDARVELSEIEATASPLLSAAVTYRTDDQPLDTRRDDLTFITFSDPLTKWEIGVGGATFDSPRTTEGAGYLRLAGEAAFPSTGVQIRAELIPYRFGDEEIELLGGLELRKLVGGFSTITLSYERSELLWTETAIDDHPWVETAVASIHFEGSPRRFVAHVEAGLLRFFDGNEGVSAGGYVLVPLSGGAGPQVTVGLSGLYRDTNENRFRLAEVRSDATETGFRYAYRGEYDPYWSPIDHREARFLATVTNRTDRRFLWRLDGSWGLARDEAIGFIPAQGFFPFPADPQAVSWERDFEPWSLGVELGGRWSRHELRIRYERSRTADYEAEEVRAAVVRRF